MDAQQILSTLQARCAIVTAQDGALRITPPEAMDTALRARMREHKVALLAVVPHREDYDADNWALVLAHARGRTNEGWALEVDVGKLYRAAN